MRVAIDREERLSADELIHRHVRALALDVPQRHVESTQRVVEYRPVAPIGTRVSVLPEVFDVVRIATASERIEIFFNGGDNGERSLIERGATESIQTWLARLDFYHDETRGLRRSFDCTHFGDFQWRESF